MKTTKIISIILCQILILSVITFAQDTSTEEEFNPENFIAKIAKTAVGDLNSEIEKTLGDDPENTKTNELLTFIKNNPKDNKETSRLIIQNIISTKSGAELNFKVNDNATIEDLSIVKTEEKETLNIKVQGKSYEIPLQDLDKSISGIEVVENGVRYTTKNDKGKVSGEIEINDPKYLPKKENNKWILSEYKGIDGKNHKFEISFSQYGIVVMEGNGEIRFSGGATIYDPVTKTTFIMKDKFGKPGYINFYNEGHIIRTIGNNIIVEKDDGLKLDIKKTNQNGMFIVAKNEITKDNHNDYPPKLDKTNSFHIDPENKHIYIPEDKDTVAHIIDTNNNYEIFGKPETPQGGTLLDGKVGIGNGGQILSTGNRGASISGGGGGGGGLGGSISSWLPLILVAAAALAAVLLLGGKKDKSASYNDLKNTVKDTSRTNNTGGNQNPVSTGREAKTSKTPTIQSAFDK